MLIHLNFLELGLILPKPGQRLSEWRGNMNPLIEGLSRLQNDVNHLC